MKHLISLLLILITALILHANETLGEFTHIQPIAVEEAPVVKIAEKKAPSVVKVKIDKDKDGVSDKHDKCPNTPKRTAVDDKGCELDSDSDGVVDSKDQCPDTSSEFLVDGYGCPQTATLKVNFDNDSYAISKTLIDDLKSFALFLQNNSTYKVIIYGYTDNNGGDEYNKKLSQNRANSVKEALTRYGIKKDRLSAIGKGSQDPVSDNSTEEGRRDNRRIEVELLR